MLGVVVRLLLATGKVDVDSKDQGGRTPIMWAGKEGHADVVQLPSLEQDKLDVDSRDD